MDSFRIDISNTTKDGMRNEIGLRNHCVSCAMNIFNKPIARLFAIIVIWSATGTLAFAQDAKKLDYPAEVEGAVAALESAGAGGKDFAVMNVVGAPESVNRWDYKNELEATLEYKDYESLLTLLKKHQMMIRLDKGFGMIFTVYPYQIDNTAFNVVRALLKKDLASVEKSLESNDGSLNEAVYFELAQGETPLIVALQNDNLPAAKMLLAAGADPDEPGKSTGSGFAPLLVSVIKEDLDAVNMLVDAGANVDTRLRFPLSQLPLLSYAASINDTALIEKLLASGANPDNVDMAGWTPLMEAVHAQHWESFQLLLPVSDPTIVSTKEITPELVEKGFERSYPRSNALYVAKQIQSPLGGKIVDALLEEIGSSGDSLSETLLLVQTYLEESIVSGNAGNVQGALAAVNAGLKIINEQSLSSESDGTLVNTAINLILNKHELALVSDQDLVESDRVLIAQLIEIGAQSKKYHDMLNIFAAAKTEFPSDMIKTWEQDYGSPSRKDWNFNVLIEWIESQEDVDVRDRLYDTLDFFELN